MTAQACIYDFAPKALPIKGWPHEKGGRAWIYRANAEATIRDLGKLPSGDGLCPRFMATPKGRWPGAGDVRHWQQCGNGGIMKEVWYDGTVKDVIAVHYGAPDEFERTELRDAWIDGGLMHIVGGDGIERTVEIHEDCEIHRLDLNPFDPARNPEHYLLLAMLKGVRGDTAEAMADMPFSFAVCDPCGKAMDAVYSTYNLTHIVPMCNQNVHHITEIEVKDYHDYTCKTCLKHRADGTCQSRDCESEWAEGMCSMYYWNGQPLEHRQRKPRGCRWPTAMSSAQMTS